MHIRKPKTKRDKGLKFFKKVGYTKQKLKNIPRWCTEMKLLDKMAKYQKENSQIWNPDLIFGKLKPKDLNFSFNELFGAMQFNLRKQRKFNKRGSSACWNDDHEF